MANKQCHKCRFNGLRDEICLKCPGPSQERNAAEVARNHKSIVSLEIMQQARHEAENENACTKPDIFEARAQLNDALVNDSQYTDTLSDFFMPQMREFFLQWIRMSGTQRDIIAYRVGYPEKSNLDIAKALEVTASHVSKVILTFFQNTQIKGRRNTRRKTKKG